jgi:hypothetical protein
MSLKSWLVGLAAKRLGKKLNLQEGPMDEKKKWYQSKAVLTGIVTVLIGTYEAVKQGLAPQFGWTLPEIPSLVYTILGALGIYSRVVADKKIG